MGEDGSDDDDDDDSEQEQQQRGGASSDDATNVSGSKGTSKFNSKSTAGRSSSSFIATLLGAKVLDLISIREGYPEMKQIILSKT